MRFTKQFAATVMLVAVAGLMISVASPTPARGAAGSAPVTVVNTAAEPVPVALHGTGSVAGTVNAAQSGAWTVGISSVPAVQLAGGTGLLVADVDNPARTAHVVELCTDDDCSGVPASATLPVGMRYVIEQASGRCEVSGGTLDGVRLAAALNGNTHLYAFKNQISAPDGETTIGYFFQETHIYVDGGIPGGSLRIELLLHGLSGRRFCRVTLSGHLVSTAPIFPAQ